MDCVELVQGNGWIILLFLLFIGAGGVGLHVWWSRRLTFFDFDVQNPENKGEVKRLVWPLIFVSTLSFLAPIVRVYSRSELNLCLENKRETLILYVSWPWNYIMPVVGGMETSILISTLIGAIIYFGIGFSIFFAWKLIKGG